MATLITHLVQNCAEMILSGAFSTERLLQHLLRSRQDVVILTNRDQELLGVISVSALFELLLSDISEHQLAQLLTLQSPCPTLTLETDIVALNAAFLQTDLPVLPVLNACNAVVGIVRRSSLPASDSDLSSGAVPAGQDAGSLFPSSTAASRSSQAEHVPDCVRCSPDVLRGNPARTISGSHALRILRDADSHHRFW